MSSPILAAKLFVPPSRAGSVRRPRLTERLDAGRGTRLTLLSAAAGFGKTTLVSEWAAETRRPVAWLSLDKTDGELARFLVYFVSAIRTVAPEVGEEALAALTSPESPPAESMLASLVAQIADVKEDFILVLDDYHLVDAPPVDAALAYLLEYLPPRVQLVVATREDPQLPLARYRARGQLTELRAADLRFSPGEAAEFLNRLMGLDLSEEVITELETRTEGWAAGLQLAALSMQGLQDPAGFVHSFAGTHRFVLDYLLEEVLHRQPEDVQRFLVHTSILESLCGPLCDAVLPDAQPPAQEVLESLERANLFVLPLDHDRRWFRYHHLFAQLLRDRLARSQPDQSTVLHLRASDWFARNDFPDEAVAHAMAAQDWPRAAGLIERSSDQWPLRSGVAMLLARLESFPAPTLLDRPRLGLQYAWALFMSGRSDRADRFLVQLLPRVEGEPALIGESYAIRVMVAAQRHDLPAFVDLAETALSVVPPEESSPRSRILLSLGVAHYETGGDLSAAESAFLESYRLGQTTDPPSSVGNAPLPATALAYLADIEWAKGNLREAWRKYEQARLLATPRDTHSSIALSLVQWGRAGLMYEWDDLEGAAAAARESVLVAGSWRNPRLLVPACGSLAVVMQALGRQEEAQEAIDRAEHAALDVGDSFFIQGLLGVHDLDVRTAQKDWRSLTRWQRFYDSDWPSEDHRVRNALAIALVRARIALHHHSRDIQALRQAQALLAPAMERSRRQGSRFDTTRLLAAESLVLHALRDQTAAVAALRRALSLAESEHYARSFIDLGRPMRDLLERTLQDPMASQQRLRTYAEQLLSRLEADAPPKAAPHGDGIVEPLTQRELEVLRLIAEGLSNREIGARLYLALSTVKGHARIIFQKLQVSRRTEAVARARDLGLL